MRRPVLAVLAALSAAVVSAAPIPLPENYETRQMMKAVIFAPVREAAAAKPRTVVQPEGREAVLFTTEKQNGSLYLVFRRPETKNVPVNSAGNYIIKRSLSDGSFQQLKIFVQDDPGCFLRLTPWGGSSSRGRTQMDVFIGSQPFQQGIILAQPLERLLIEPFTTIMDLSAGIVDWTLVLPAERTDGDARLEDMVKALRKRLPGLGDVEDGAMDSAGRFVFIKDGSPQKGTGGLNCSGFAKLVVDGFFKPLTGRLMDISVLKERQMDARGNLWSPRFEESNDPYFGLDWSRALACQLEAARSGGSLPPPEFADVRDVERFPYVEDVGFPIADLFPIFYVLARRQPGAFYLGSLNREAEDGSPVRQHHHVAVFFPYIDSSSVFRVVVMERNIETSLQSIQSRFPRDDVHLVRITAEGEFTLP